MRFPALCLLCLSGASASLTSGAPESSDEGQALAAKLRAEVPMENSQTRGLLKIETPTMTNEVPVICEIKVLEGTWEASYQTAATARSGPEKLVVIHGGDGPNRYLYGRAPALTAPLPEVRPLATNDLSTPLAGSDFWVSDLGLDFLHWPQQKQLKGEMRLGRACYVLESRNPNGYPIARVVSDIDEESGGLLVATAYDSAGRVVKEFSLHGSSFKKVKGKWVLEKMEIRDRNRHSRTILKFDIKPKE